MLDFGDLNYWAIITAWVISCAVGAFWYSPKGFAKQWKQQTGVDIMKIPEQEATKILGYVVASAAVQVISLAVVLNSLNVTEAAEGLKAGLLLWLGFVAATTVGTTLYQRRTWKFLWLNSSYFLIVIAINSVILGVWQ